MFYYSLNSTFFKILYINLMYLEDITLYFSYRNFVITIYQDGRNKLF